jgi:hypothetical protein
VGKCQFEQVQTRLTHALCHAKYHVVRRELVGDPRLAINHSISESISDSLTK